MRGIALIVAGLAGAVSCLASAQTLLPPITVGVSMQQSALESLSSLPEALPAATTVLDAADIARKPVQHYTDIFRNLPGMTVSNYGQGGIAFGVAMRGFSLGSHGRDIAYAVDGVPLNELSSQHTPNYADLNYLLPETIERIEIVRGPFSVELGEANVAGSVNIVTKRYDVPQGSLGYGSDGTKRGYAAHGQRDEAGRATLVAVELYGSDGYRANSEVERYNVFTKYSQPLGDGIVSARIQAYASHWGAPHYIGLDNIRNGAVSERAAVSESDGGQRNLQSLVLNYASHDPDNGWSLTTYFTHAELARYSTNPVTLAQGGSFDKRETFGGNGKRVWTSERLGLPLQFMAGASLRGDQATIATATTVNRQESGFTRLLEFTEYNAAGFAQAQVRPVDWLKLTLGGRYDHFFYDVDNRLTPTQSPSTDSGGFAPKAGIALTPLPHIDFFANIGTGFRSPSAATEIPSNPGLKVQKLTSRELGFLLHDLPLGASLRASRWQTKQNSEIFSPGGGLPPQNLGQSERNGSDVELRLRLLRGEAGSLGLLLAYSIVDADLIGRPAASKVPAVPDSIGTIMLEGQYNLRDGETLSGSLGLQFVGEQFINEAGNLRADPYQVVSAQLSYAFGSGWSLFGNAHWRPNDRYSEIILVTSNIVATSPQPRFNGMAGIAYRF